MKVPNASVLVTYQYISGDGTFQVFSTFQVSEVSVLFRILFQCHYFPTFSVFRVTVLSKYRYFLILILFKRWCLKVLALFRNQYFSSIDTFLVLILFKHQYFFSDNTSQTLKISILFKILFQYHYFPNISTFIH